MVYDVAQKVSIPIIGMGGISNIDDVVDFLSAGASAVAIGTANFVDPFICPKLIEQLPGKLDELGFNTVTDLVGRSHRL